MNIRNSQNSLYPSRLLLTGVALASLAVSLLSEAAIAQTPQPATAEADGASLDEIIVTANRRQERGQDVPIAITAMSPQRLEQQGITKEQDLAASVPSLVVGQNGQGSRDSQSFTIRGQGATFQASPGVVVYLGEVPLPAAITLSQQGGPGNFVDLENLQVLSGPQGTLFGRNTTGGAVLLVPKKPTNELGGWIKGEYGNYNRVVVEGAVNLPIVEDKVLLRVAGAFHDRDGFTHDVTFNKDRDNEHWYSGRVGLTLKPTEKLQNYTMFYYSKSDNNGTGLVNKGFNINGLKAVGFCTDPGDAPSPIGVPCDVYRGVTARADALGPRQTAFSTDVFQQTLSWGMSNTTDLELTDELKLRNIASYQKLRIRYRYDGDATVLQQHDVDPGVLPGTGVVTSPFPINYFNATLATELPRDDLRQVTEELQLQGDMLDHKLIWTVGGFYYNQKPDGKQGSRAVVYCPAAFTGFCGASYAQYGTSTVSKALYGQATLNLGLLTPALDKFKLTGGYRNTWDHVSGFATQFSQQTANPALATCGADNSTVPFATAAAGCQFSASLKTSAASWLVGLDYKINRDVLLYGKISRGYKAGGFNQYAVFTNTRTFAPETVTSYEIGVKSDFRLGDVPFRVNVAAYTLDYKGIQRATGDFNPTTQAGGARTYNADARIKGIELEASMHPVKGVEIGGNFSYTDAHYTKYQYITNSGGVACNGVVAPGGIGDSSCLRFQYSAPYIYSVHVSAEQPLGDNAGTLAMFVNYSHTSSQNTEAVQLAALQPGSVIKPYGLLSASLDWREVMGSKFDIGVFGTNLTNKLYSTSNSDVYQGGGLLYWAAIYGEPRMYGVRAKFHFGGE